MAWQMHFIKQCNGYRVRRQNKESAKTINQEAGFGLVHLATQMSIYPCWHIKQANTKEAEHYIDKCLNFHVYSHPLSPWNIHLINMNFITAADLIAKLTLSWRRLSLPVLTPATKETPGELTGIKIYSAFPCELSHYHAHVNGIMSKERRG